MGFTLARTGSAAQKPGPPRTRVQRLFIRVGIGALSLAALTVLFYGEENWRGRHAWSRYHEAAARRVDFKWQSLAPPPIADQDNFAATPFLAALFDLIPGTHTPRDLPAYNRVAGFAQGNEPYLEARHPERTLLTVVPGERTDLAPALQKLRQLNRRPGAPVAAEAPPTDHRAQAVAVLDGLQQFGPVIEELRAASKRPSVRFDLNYNEETPWRVPEPHLPVLKRVCMVLGLRALAELALDNTHAAADDAYLLLAIANSLASEPLQNSYWTRLELLAIARQVLWEGLADHRWSDRQLRDFQDDLAGLDLPRDVSKPLLLDRAHGEYLFNLIRKQPAAVSGWQFGPGLGNWLLPRVLRWMPRGWMDRERLTYHRRFDDDILAGLDAAAGRVRPQLIDRAVDRAHPLWHHSLLTSRVLGTPAESIFAAALAQTRSNQARVACALERYRLQQNQLPPKLENLVPDYLPSLPNDLLTGTPLKYRLTADGSFLLYSVGWNRHDDDGKIVLNKGKELESRQGDWVWPR